MEKVIITINAELTLTKSGESSKEKDFRIIVPTKLGEIIFFPVSVILAKEEKQSTCSFDLDELEYLNDDFKISKDTAGNGEEIYGVEHLESKEKFEFAVRSCIRPPGWGAEEE